LLSVEAEQVLLVTLLMVLQMAVAVVAEQLSKVGFPLHLHL
jgi:hypothetical protein